MSFEGGILGRGWIPDGIDSQLDQDEAGVHPATIPVRSAQQAAVLPPNLNPADPDYGSRGLPPVRTPVNQCNLGDADACILPQFGFSSFNPEIGHNDSYYTNLNEVAQKGVTKHEESHQEFQRRWYDDNFDRWQKFWAPLPWSDIRSGYETYDPAQDEITAYKTEADYLENYLNTHPNDPNYSALQQRWLDRWQKIDDYKNGRLKR